MGQQRNKKIEQHIVPKTYLKYWKIADNRSFVYGIDFEDEYNMKIQEFGLSQKVFTRKKYYNNRNLEDPYIIEDVLGEEVEPRYNEIMDKVILENDLSKDIKIEIAYWLYFSQLRSPIMRDSPSQLLIYFLKILNESQNLPNEIERQIEEYGKQSAKDFHLSLFEDLKLYKEGFITLLSKQWRILKSNTELEFWTNDNPGFSPNLMKKSAIQDPYIPIMQMDDNSIIYYPLSPKYCLEIKPFEDVKSPRNKDEKIKYDQASPELIVYINSGVIFTINRVLVSNSKETLELYVSKFLMQKTLKEFFYENSHHNQLTKLAAEAGANHVDVLELINHHNKNKFR